MPLEQNNLPEFKHLLQNQHFVSNYNFEQLQKNHKQFNYRELFKKQAINLGSSEQFELGGHDYGYAFIKFNKINDDWFLSEITFCD